MSEKQSVEMRASRSKIQLEEAEEKQDVGSWIVSYKSIKQQLQVQKHYICIVGASAGLWAAVLDRFLNCLWHLYKPNHN